MAKGSGKQSSFELRIGAIDRFSNTFKAFNDRVAKSTARLNGMKASLLDLSRATGITRVTGSVKGLVGNMKNAATEGKNLFNNLWGWAGKASLLFGGAGVGILALARGTANAGDEAAKAAARAGVGLRTWQEYSHVAGLANVSNEQLEKSFRHLQDMGIKASKGDKASRGLLRLAGIDPKTAHGEIKNADTLMLELSDKVKALNDAGKGAEAANLVSKIFGDQGSKLMPMLLEGADGLKKMRLEAHKLGLVFSEEDAAASAAFNDGISKLTASFRGVGFTIGRKILPLLTPLIEKFTEWMAVQREIIGTRLDKWIAKYGNVDTLWESIESGLNTLGKFISGVDSIAQAFGGWGNTIGILSSLMAGKFIYSLANVIMSLGKVKIALMTTPIGWIMAGIVALGTAAYVVYKNWDDIVSYFKGLTAEVRAAFERNWLEGVVTLLRNFSPVRLVMKGLNELINYFTGIDLAEIGSKWVNGIQDGIGKKWAALVGWLKEKFADLTDWMPDWAKEKIGINVSANTSSTDAPQSTGASPLNLAPVAQRLSEMRTEHVEKAQYELVVRSEDGTKVDMQRTGGTGGYYNPQTGVLASGH